MQVEHQQVLQNRRKSKGGFVSLHLLLWHSHVSLLRLTRKWQTAGHWPTSSSPGSGWTVPRHLRDEPLQPQPQSSGNSHAQPHCPPAPILRLRLSDEEEDRDQQHCAFAHTYTENTYYYLVHTISCFSYISFIATGGAHPLHHALCHSGCPQ